MDFKYNHLGIPVSYELESWVKLPHLKMTVSDPDDNPFRIQWQRFWDDTTYPEIVTTKPHLAFEVENIDKLLGEYPVIIDPNYPSKGLRVCFIRVNDQPIELMEYENT